MITINYRITIIFLLFVLSLIYTYPNILGEDPVIIIKKNLNNYDLDEFKKNFILDDLKIKYLEKNNSDIIIRFFTTEDQFSAYELLKSKYNENFNISLNILSKNNIFLKKINAQPMKLGLDLRGGVHLLIKVETKKNIEEFIINKILSLKKELLNENNLKINIKKSKENKIKIFNKKEKKLENVNLEFLKLNDEFEILKITDYSIVLNLIKRKKNEIKTQLINKTIYILSKRINELGIADSTVQTQGKNKIVIEIPGIQDINRAKNILGKTATLDFMLVDTENNLKKALNGKQIKKSKIFYTKNNLPILLKDKSLISGNDIIYATSGFEQIQNKPCVNIKLSKKNINNFEKITYKNIGNPMAILYRESFVNSKNKLEIKETVISVATIMSTLSRDFQITGLNLQESKDLALLLRSGSLPSTLSIIEEKIIGPTLGENNIKSGVLSIIISYIFILLFMFLRYKILGIISNIALTLNILLLISMMSIIGITLTLPGLAGIALTIAMSIDANILIFERIKEEIKTNKIYEYAIENGFSNASKTIIDSNLTTLLIGIILFLFSYGPIKGFAITLSLGIITSMYSAFFITKTITEYFLIKKIKLI